MKGFIILHNGLVIHKEHTPHEKSRNAEHQNDSGTHDSPDHFLTGAGNHSFKVLFEGGVELREHEEGVNKNT